MATNFWELLQQHQGDLTKSGRTVADYLVQHAAEAQYLSISSLAKECCVAEATVFRFCRALGFEGYHEMRIALAQANATGALVNQHVPEPDADTATLCEHASALLMTTINGTQNNLSPEAVDKASELMHKARQVYCLGQGGSMYIANDICARFACISTKFRTAGDSHMQLIPAQSWRISCCCVVRRKARWTPATSRSRWRCCMWLKCWCCATPWTTPKMPTPHRIAPVKHWRSKCCKNIARKAPADPVFCGGLGISGKGCVKSVSDLFLQKNRPHLFDEVYFSLAS